MSTNDKIEDYSRLIEFSLGSQLYAVPLLKVREVIQVPKITPIPKAPDYFEGVMNLRGQIISIIDMRKKLEISDGAEIKEPAAIIIDLSSDKVGILVDSINTVLHIKEGDILTYAEGKDEKTHPYILDVYNKSEEELVIIVDIEKALDAKDLDVVKNDVAA